MQKATENRWHRYHLDSRKKRILTSLFATNASKPILGLRAMLALKGF